MFIISSVHAYELFKLVSIAHYVRVLRFDKCRQ